MQSEELRRLEEEYAKSGNRIVVFCGRSGLEKEVCLGEFLAEKQSFYYRAVELSASEQKKRMAAEIEEQYRIHLKDDNYETCFDKIRSGDGSRLVLVIDGFETIMKKDSDFIRSLILLKQKKLYRGPVLILLVTDSLVWTNVKMNETLGADISMIDNVIRQKEMNFLDVVRYFPMFSVSECVQVYGILGGVSGYLKYWNPKEDVKNNVCKLILSGEGRLFFEAETYLRKELRELSVYNTILSAIAAGNKKLNDLYRATGFSRAKISVYLKNLMAFDVIEKVISFETGGWENTQKGIYQIKNTFLNFWFTFVFPHLSDLYRIEPETFFDKYIKDGLNDYLNRYFIQVCMEYMELLNQVGRLPIRISKIGTWVGKQGTIDIVAQNNVRENIVGICNWSEEVMGAKRCLELDDLMAQAKIKAKQCYLFSATTFDESLKEFAERNKNIILIDMTEL